MRPQLASPVAAAPARPATMMTLDTLARFTRPMRSYGMGEDLDELAAKGRAAREAAAAREATNRASNGEWRTAEIEKTAVRRISPLALNPLRFMFSIPFFTLWLGSAFVSIPYFRYFATGAPVHGGITTRWVLDPTKEGYALFYPFPVLTLLAIVGAVWWRRCRAAGRVALAAEAEWAKTLPFPIIGYPDVFGHEDERYRMKLEFATRPDLEKLRDILAGIDPYVTAETLGDYPKFIATYPRDHEARNTQRFAATFHAIAAVLARVHAEHPIELLEVC
jgi:hypothetical protein